MLDEGILGHRDRIVGFNEVDKGFVGEIKIQGIGVIKVVFRNVNFSLINICLKYGLLL